MIELLLASALAFPHATTGAPAHDAIATQQIELCGHHFAEHPLGKIDYFLYFPTEQHAIDMAAAIDEQVFFVQARTSAARPDWVVYVRYRTLPTVEQVRAGDARLQALTAQHAGEYNGHSCGTVPYPRPQE